MGSILGTLVVLLILLAVVGAIIWSMVKDKKNGKSSCGGNCSAFNGQTLISADARTVIQAP